MVFSSGFPSFFIRFKYIGVYKITPFEAYTKYLALKNHFTSDTYDFFKYDGKVTAREDNFEKRKDKYFFYKLSKKKDVDGFLVSNLLSNTKLWVGDLSSKKCDDIYMKWKSKQESLSYVFKNEIDKMDDDFDTNFKVVDGQYPPLLRQYQFDEISLETLVILNKLINFIPHWDKKISDSIIWPEISMRIKKYEPFVNFDEKKVKAYVLERFS